jgi:hypothetical protein
MPTRFARTLNGRPLREAAVPVLPIAALRSAVLEVCQGGARLVALFSRRLEGGGARLYAVLGDDYEGRLAIAAADLAPGELRYPSLTTDLPEAHWFERELLEEAGIPRVTPGRSRSAARRAIPSSASRATRSTRSASGPSTPGSSSRGTSASSATARR